MLVYIIHVGQGLVDGLLGPASGVGIRFQVLSAGFWHGL